jgi:hypothetical protein
MNQQAKRERLRQVRSACVDMVYHRRINNGANNAWFKNRMANARRKLRNAWRR